MSSGRLELLLVAQQSEYLWQRIRLERVRTAELLAEHLASDRRLAHQLREVLSTYAVLRLSEVHHIFIGDRLSKARRTLGDGVDRFVELRTRQVANWDDLHDATLGDALRVASAQASKLATGARRGIASGAGAVARWVDPDDSAGPTTSAKPELNLAPGPIAPVRDEE